MFSSCSKSNPESFVTPTPSPPQENTDKIVLLSSSNQVIDPNGGSCVINFSSSGAWTASILGDNNTWCSISPTAGSASSQSFNVTVSKNNTNSLRTASLRIQCGAAYSNITISQDFIKVLSISPNSLTLESNSQTIEIKVVSNVDFSVGIPSDCNWVHKEKNNTNGVCLFTIDENPQQTSRSVIVKFIGGSIQQELTIQQNGKEDSDFDSEIDIVDFKDNNW